jgi:hypothetical protein
MFALLLSLALAQTGTGPQLAPASAPPGNFYASPSINKKTAPIPRPRWNRSNGRPDRGFTDYVPAFFEFAPLSGAGMGSPCACTTPTGAKGEALTFTRASSGTCLKSTSATNIANGDLVTCASNQPRVMPGFDPSGVLGLLVEATATNSVFQSQALGTSPWAGTSGVVAAPTVTNNFAVAPDGTTTATRLQIPATDASGIQYSAVFQPVTIGAGNSLASMFVKGNGSSGVIDLCWNTLVKQCVICSFTATAWARCVSGVGTNGNQVFIGNMSLTGYATGPRAASDVLVWGVQGELNNYATSYIATTAAAATRSLETATINGSTLPLVAGYSKAATVVVPWFSAGNIPTTPNLIAGEVSTTGGSDMFLVGLSLRNQNCGAGTCGSVTSGTITIAGAYVPQRFAADYASLSTTLYQNGTSIAGPSAIQAPANTMSTTTGLADNTVALNHIDGVIKQICWDSTPGRCR